MEIIKIVMEKTSDFSEDIFQSLNIGDKIRFTLNDEKFVEALACDKTSDGIIFITEDIITTRCMNEEDTTVGGYEASDMRKWLNEELIKMFPTEVREHMIPFENGDLLRLPTEKEIFGENRVGETESEEVQQFEAMKDKRNRVAFNGEYTDWYWLANVSKYWSSSAFAVVYCYGYAVGSYASTSYGVRPIFQIKL